MEIALICVALLGILLFELGIAVSLVRGRRDTAAGTSGEPTDGLHKLVRAHGNTSENVGLLAVLILVLGSREPGTWAVVFMVGATASRYLLAMGIILSRTLAKVHPLRFLGALGTYVFGLGLCVEILRSL